uniref:Uncharacterized protein n=1 Tax=Rhizophora mucronata TaxID=61149 RepID=A0A2P2LYP0_RHIMU
MQCHLNPR